MTFSILKIWNFFSRKARTLDGYKKFQITCGASIDTNYSAYISLTKGWDRKEIAKYTIDVERYGIMIDIGHNEEVVGIEILGKTRVPSILKEHLDK